MASDNKLIRVWCEWDIGQENIIFSDREDAYEWLNANQHIAEMTYPVDDLLKDGLLGFEEVTLYV